MKQKNPKFKFLNINPNPTLGDLLSLFQKEIKSTSQSVQHLSALVNDLRQDIGKLSIPKGIVDLIEQIQRRIEEKDFFGARDKIKNGLIRIKLLQEHSHIQQKVETLYKNIEKAIEYKSEETIHEKALLLFSELVYLDKSIYSPLSEVENELSGEAFTLYIAFQTIGCVNGDGWAFGIFGNMPQLVPYIPDAFEKIGYEKTPRAIRNAINVFPENTNFLFDNEEYIDVLNFIENPRRKVESPKLEKYTIEEREQFCMNYHNSLKKIEEVEDEIWSEKNEWEGIIKYYNDNLEKKIWKTTHNKAYK